MSNVTPIRPAADDPPLVVTVTRDEIRERLAAVLLKGFDPAYEAQSIIDVAICLLQNEDIEIRDFHERHSLCRSLQVARGLINQAAGALDTPTVLEAIGLRMD
ncbi:MAG: hypothetical protein ACYDAE_00270 [Steroidobacteraceae bacterium]